MYLIFLKILVPSGAEVNLPFSCRAERRLQVKHVTTMGVHPINSHTPEYMVETLQFFRS
jgi:hypothetical protein